MSKKRRYTNAAAAAIAVLAVGTLTACGSDSGGSKTSGEGAGKLPATVPVTYVSDATGPAGPVGQADLKGMQAAVENAKRTGLIDSKIDIKVLDTGGDSQKATTLTAQAGSSDAIAMFGPAISSEGLPAAQIAQRSKLPYLSVQSNAPGLSDQGEYTYAATVDPARYTDLTTNYVKDEFGAKSVSFIYGADSPSLTNGWKTFVEKMKAAGIQVKESVGLPLSTTDFSAAATKVADSKPDAVGVLLTASQNASAISALRRAGYDGKVFASNGSAGGYLKAAGKAAAGVPYAVSYGPGMPFASSKAFDKLFAELNNGAEPTLFNAEGYAAMDLFLHALAASKDASRDGVLKGLKEVAAAGGFDSSIGRVTLGGPNKRDALSPGALIVWDGSKETIVPTKQQ